MSQPIVSVEGVAKRFGEVTALAGVDLSFQEGIIYGLLGPNGAGKTTLIRILTTLLRPDAGHVEVAGVDVLADPVTARTRIGLAGQSAAVDEYLTGLENVLMVGRLYGLTDGEARRRAMEVLERIDLLDASHRPVRTYSGGMRRRLDLAASMVGRPQVLFLDEPTTAIDPRSRIDIWDLIEDLVAGGTTILLTTQYLDEADRLAARIAVIDHGHLITEGTPDELKDKVGGSVVQVIVTEEQQAAAIEAMATVSGEHPTVEPTSGRISISADHGARSLIEVVRALDGRGVTPVDIALRKPTLDDVFLTLTGHPAEERSPSEPDEPRPDRRRRPT